MSHTVIECQDVSYSIEGRLIFDRLSLKIFPGQITAIIGPSGVGKTTLLRLMGGLLSAESGRVCVFGQDMAHISRTQQRAIRQRMGFLFQQGALFTDLSVFDNVAFPLREHTQHNESTIRDLVLMRLEAVGLRGAAQLAVNELSGGMARRVALARALMLDPQVMLYDEPFTGQDPINKSVLLNLINSLNKALGIASVLVSHDISETLSIADYVYVLGQGRVLAAGTSQEIGGIADASVQQFLQGQPDGPIAFRYPACTMAEDLGLNVTDH